MRIAHVVTYVSEDNAYGGPVTVAFAQSAELASRGHEVELFAAWDGRGEVRAQDVVPRLARGWRLHSFALTLSPGVWWRFIRRLRQLDAVHVHLARDLVTLPLAWVATWHRVRLVVQTHGMVRCDDRAAVRVLDRLVTRRVLRRSLILTLTQAEQADIRKIAGAPVRIRPITNAVRPLPGVAVHSADRRERTVVFIARLHSRKRVDLFIEAARRYGAIDPTVRFVVHGPDEGDLDQVLRAAEELPNLSYGGPLATAQVPLVLQRASVFVLPSVGEVFPMTVLEALGAGTPVVLADDCGIAPELTAFGACVPVAHAPDEIVSAVGRLLDDMPFREAVLQGAAAANREWLSIERVADQLERAYGVSAVSEDR